MADDDERALETARANPPASRSRPGRDGWSARRAAARRALRASARTIAARRRSPPLALFASMRGRSRAARRSRPPHNAAGASSPASTQSASVACPLMSGILLQQHDLGARNDRPPPFVGVDHPGEAFEQGRLARAVAADQRQPVPRRRPGCRFRGTASLRPGPGRGLHKREWGAASCAALARCASRRHSWADLNMRPRKIIH